MATINLERKAIRKRIKRNSTEEDEEMRSSQHSLVANSDSSTPPRTMNVDYRLEDTRVPVTLPNVFVWILAASLSVPEFALAVTAHVDNNIIICTLDSNHRFNMHSMLTVFNFFLPVFIMSTLSALIVVKLKSTKKPLVVDNCETVAALKLSLWLIFLYCVFCAPYILFSAYRIYSSGNNTVTPEGLFYRNLTTVNLALNSSYLLGTIIRAGLCVMLLPRLRSVFSYGLSKDADHV